MFVNSLVLLSLFSVSVSAVPHASPFNHHRGVAARQPAPRPVAFEPPTFNWDTDVEASLPKRSSLRKRSLNKRCKTRKPPVASSSSAAAAPTTPVANAGGDPATTDAPAPAPTTSAKPKPTTTKQEDPAPSPTKKPASSGSSNSNLPSFMTGTQTGQGTFYGTGLGACGIVNKDTDYIAAVSHLLFDTFPGYNGANPNNNPMCGRKVKATYKGKSVTVALTDRCTGCAITDLDFSPSAFNTIADPAIGRISGMTWVWV